MLFKNFYMRHIAWRRTYYRTKQAASKYLSNPGIIVGYEAASNNSLSFKHGANFAFQDKETAIQTFKEIFVDEIYKLNGDETIILDIGANIGLFSCYAALKSPMAKIFAIEADPANYEKLKRNFYSDKKLANMSAEHYALAAVTQERDFYCSDVSGWSSLSNTRGASQAHSVRVHGITINEFCEKHEIGVIDLMKIDIEGAEYELIMEDSKFFDVPCNKLILEADVQSRMFPDYRIEDLTNILKCHYRSIDVRTDRENEYSIVFCDDRF